MDMKRIGAIAGLLLFAYTSVNAQSITTNSRFEASFTSRSLAHPQINNSALLGLEISFYNKSRTFSIGAFASTDIQDSGFQEEALPSVTSIRIRPISNFNTAGLTARQQVLSKNRLRADATTSLSMSWYDGVELDGDVLSYGPTGFIALEPGFSLSYDITNRFLFRVTPSYLFSLGPEVDRTFNRLNIGASFGFRF